MKLVKQKCCKKGLENYYDVSLVYEYQNKTYSVRVRPVFWRDMKLLMAHAKDVK